MKRVMAGKGAEVLPIEIKVKERNDVVVLEFDKVVSWIGIDPVQAIKVAEQMKCKAVEILRNSKGK